MQHQYAISTILCPPAEDEFHMRSLEPFNSKFKKEEIVMFIEVYLTKDLKSIPYRNQVYE